ncbi:MAG: dTDP-4-dehydrorhamnose reductase [Fimbriiglobus sp.]|jgi:dTDP-4-dehydrorhamnose reductase|nr:dTDP-4-dehydrorhamnose reductase [Fimbriiglobus sp.]
MRIAVLGSAGQLGRDLVTRLTGEVLPLTRADIDLANPHTIVNWLSTNKPDVLVNCAAYNLVDKAEEDPAAAFAVNATGVKHLAETCQPFGIRLVHVSTDYVFGADTSRTSPYRETDTPGPVSKYGESKLAGEQTALAVPGNLVVRTCGLYGVWGSGGKGGNFVETMLRVAGQGKPLRVVADQRCTPTYTADLAEGMANLIAQGTTGLVHLTNAGDCSWHEFAAAIFALSGISADLTPITSGEFGAKAPRPGYSVLGSERTSETGVQERPWPEALAAYLTERDKRRP